MHPNSRRIMCCLLLLLLLDGSQATLVRPLAKKTKMSMEHLQKDNDKGN